MAFFVILGLYNLRSEVWFIFINTCFSGYQIYGGSKFVFILAICQNESSANPVAWNKFAWAFLKWRWWQQVVIGASDNMSSFLNLYIIKVSGQGTQYFSLYCF